MKPIVTLTLNPCLDQITSVDRVEPDRKLRMDQPHYEPGGGGVNVSRAIRRLGGETRAIHTCGGPDGGRLNRLLDGEDVPHEAIDIEGDTRVNANVFESGSDRLYRFIMPGPKAEDALIDACLAALDATMSSADYVVISGSLLPGLSGSAYANLAAHVGEASKRVLLDCSGAALREAVSRGVYFIKPNFRELSELAERTLDSDRDVEEAASRLVQEREVAVVMVSLGGGGAMLVTGERVERVAAPTVTIRSRIGAGDSLMAGVALALGRGRDLVEAARLGVAAGAAAVMTPGTELCRREDTEGLYELMSQSTTEQEAS